MQNPSAIVGKFEIQQVQRMPGNLFLDELTLLPTLKSSLLCTKGTIKIYKIDVTFSKWGSGLQKSCQFLHRLWNFSNSEFSPMHFCLQPSACPLKSSNIKDSPLKQTGSFFLAMKSTTFHFYITTKFKSEHLEISIPKSAPSKRIAQLHIHWESHKVLVA